MSDQRRPTFFEKIMLFNYKISRVRQITNTMSLFEVENSNICAILKTTDSGKMQYHKLNRDELQKLKDDLGKVKAEAQITTSVRRLFSALLSRKRCRPPSNLLICMVSDNFT